MIDSVVLKLTDFILYRDSYFTQRKYQELKGKYGIYGKFLTQYTDYPQQAKKEGKYFPQVTIMQRQRLIKGSKGQVSTERYLLVQVSMPKLLYGLNLFDIDERMLPLFAHKLRQALLFIHVDVSEQNILNGIVQRVDYSKIVKTSSTYGTSTTIMQELARYDAKQSSDFNLRDVRSGRDTSYIKFYNSSQGFVIYDKFDEIAVNGTSRLEQALAEAYQRGEYTYGAMRIELSLQRKQTVESVLRRFYKNKRANFTLSEVARSDIAQVVLVDTFEKIYIRGFTGMVYLSRLKETDLLHHVRSYTGNFNHQAILYLLAHRVRAIGLKAAVAELKNHVSASTINRYKKQVEQILLDASAKRDRVNVIGYLHRKLKKFTPVIPKELDTTLGSRI